jgi:signal transduction histidine kinase
MDLLNRDQEVSLQTCLTKLLLQPKIADENQSNQSPPVVPSVSTPPTPIPISPERILQFKQRHIELDRAVEKLIETIKYETHKNVKQISKYWSYIKQISLDKYQPKGNPYQLFDYLLKSTYLNREYELFFEQNDEITAAIQVLSTTLSIVSHQHSFTVINRIFDEEEKLMREQLHHQLESLLSSYTDELSFMRERIRFYQTNANGEKDFDWIQIIQIDYPYLIEKLSNDFLIEIPRIEQILLQLLRNTKKHLLSIHTNDIRN